MENEFRDARRMSDNQFWRLCHTDGLVLPKLFHWCLMCYNNNGSRRNCINYYTLVVTNRFVLKWNLLKRHLWKCMYSPIDSLLDWCNQMRQNVHFMSIKSEPMWYFIPTNIVVLSVECLHMYWCVTNPEMRPDKWAHCDFEPIIYLGKLCMNFININRFHYSGLNFEQWESGYIDFKVLYWPHKTKFYPILLKNK